MIAFAALDNNFALKEEEIEVLARLFNRLSGKERGADNDTMPYTHKLRHNPAIHQLHICTLIDHLFTRAFEGYAEQDYKILEPKINKVKQRLMIMALVHDLGELEGELSYGSDKQKLSAAALEKFEQQRNDLEYEVFEMNLRFVLERSIDDRKRRDKIYTKFAKAFEDSEKKDFIGLFFKSCERMQSQHDYIGFNPLPENAHKPAAVRLSRTSSRDKLWSGDYVGSVFLRISRTGKQKKSVKELALEEQDPQLQQIYSALTLSFQHQLDLLNGNLARAFNLPQH